MPVATRQPKVEQLEHSHRPLKFIHTIVDSTKHSELVYYSFLRTKIVDQKCIYLEYVYAKDDFIRETIDRREHSV